MATMQIFTKAVGKEPVPVTVNLSDTIGQLQEKLQLSNVKMRLRAQTLAKSKTFEEYKVVAGDVLAIFPNNQTPKGFNSRAQYAAKNRLDTGKATRSYTHPQLHAATQEIVMQESAMLAQKMDKTQQNLKDKIDDLKSTIDNETVPLNKSQRDWSEKLNPLPVSTLNEILDKVSLPKNGQQIQQSHEASNRS